MPIVLHAQTGDTALYQQAQTPLRVLVPDASPPKGGFRLVLVLPTEAEDNPKWVNPLPVIEKSGLHNELLTVFALPSFTDLPWYADHPTRKDMRQESFVRCEVLPWIRSHHPVSTAPGDTLLLGASKSGWGAFSLLLRHPDEFGKALAWDAPLDHPAPDRWGMLPIFGSEENFAEYQITSLLQGRAAELKGPPRLIVTGYGIFGENNIAIHALMDSLGVSHIFRNDQEREHAWLSGWLLDAVRLLCDES